MRGPARERRRRARRVRAVGGARYDDRVRHRGRQFPGAASRRRRRGPARERARRRLPAVRPRAVAAVGRVVRGRGRGSDRGRVAGRDAAGAAALGRISPRGARCSSSTTRSCSRARCAAPTRPTRRCWSWPDGRPAIAVAIDGNGRRVACDPRRGAAEAVYECAANLACVGAEPLGLTNCLNFGNPEKPHVAWQLVEAVEGLAGACEQLGVPVVGGNVSLYNEAPTGPIFPTPVVGIVGKLPSAARAGRLGFARGRRDRAGRAVRAVGGRVRAVEAAGPSRRLGELPATDVGRIRVAHGAVRSRVRSGAFRSAHDIAEGGVAVALAECAIAGGLGATVDLPTGLDPFGEAPGRGFIVSGPRDALAGFVVIGRGRRRRADDRGAARHRSFRPARRPRVAGWREWV